MTSYRAAIVAVAFLIGCATPLTVAEEREGRGGTRPPGSFEETGPLDSGFANDADTFVADPPSDAGEDG